MRLYNTELWDEIRVAVQSKLWMQIELVAK